MTIRVASSSDLMKILKLYEELNPEDSSIDLNTAESIWNKSINKCDISYIMAIENNEIIATCNIAIIPNLTRSGRPYGVIENVITKKEYRRMGIGKEIMIKAIDIAKKKNCYKVVLLSSIKRIEAHKFYESIGFSGNTKKGYEIRFI
jgi:predicted GNAT family N-acyltransferase